MLSNRLKSLTKYVEKKDLIIDIGCDHALLDIFLIQNKIVDHIIASDIHPNALEYGRENIRKYKLEAKIETRCGDGLNVLTNTDNIDTAIISGMGTNTIINILSNSWQPKLKKLIIQSNNNHYELRKHITELGYIIEDEEYFIANKKNYINIVFKRGEKRYSKDLLKYGPILIHNPHYLQFEIDNILKIKKLIPKMKLYYKLKLNLELIKIKNYLRKCHK